MIALLLIVLSLVLAAPASASSTQETVFQDDNLLVYSDDQRTEETMAALKQLGVDRIRVSVICRLLAPAADSPARPAFRAGGASDPAAYGAGAWDRYDRIVAAAARYGIGVLFTITAPGPLWATANPNGGNFVDSPRASDFGDFVTAVGRRYSGTFSDSQPTPAPRPGGLFGLFPPPAQPPGPAPRVLPRVSTWSIWNEPNQPGWLFPQTTRVGSTTVPRSPHVFRALLDAGWRGLVASGHGSDTFLLGETAPRGTVTSAARSPMRPLLFVRELYCLDRRLRPLTGGAASARGCPPDRAGRLRFASEHPALFRATGYAHHPYAIDVAPSSQDRIADQVTISGLGRLTRTLDGIFRRYGQRRRLPLHLTEYGYQTNPPDPIIGVSWRKQAGYLNEGEYIAFRNRRVRSFAQFLLIDDGPNTRVDPRDPRYWGSTFQSGLVALDGRRKPSFAAFQRPIFATPGRVRRGRSVRLLAGLRPAPAGARLRASIQFRRGRSGRWRTVRRVTVRNSRGYLFTRVRLTRSGFLRVAWASAPGGVSRAVAVSVRR
jgi:hypothetical protein